MTAHLDPHKEEHLWSQYLEGDLDSAERESLQAHLRECEECQLEVKLLRQTVDMLSQLSKAQTIQAPEDFLPKVHRRLRKGRIKRRADHSQTEYGQTLTSALIFVTLILITLVLIFTLQFI